MRFLSISAFPPASFRAFVGPCGLAVLFVAGVASCGSKGDEGPSGSGVDSPSTAGGSRATESGSGAVWFEEVAAASGIDFVHQYGPKRFWIPEVTGSGVGLFDADGDGDLDLYALQACDLEGDPEEQPTNRFYVNDGRGRFEDQTEAAGLGHPGFAMGCTAGDYDGDGDVDLYITNVGPNVLYQNQGDGTFVDVTEAAGVQVPAWSTSAAFLDYDGDGHTDLFVTNYLVWQSSHEVGCFGQGGEQAYCNPNRYQGPERDTLLRNKGDGTFEDVSLAVGLKAAFGPGLGVVWGHWNDDRYPDLYVANDGEANQLWYGEKGGTFREEALLMGAALSGNGQKEAGMGIVMGDLDRNGTWDLFVTHLRGQTHTFYSGGRRGFRDATRKTGTATSTKPYTGFGVGWFDFDHDGFEDLYIASGRVTLSRPVLSEDNVLAEPDQVFPGLAGGRFGEALPNGGLAQEALTVGRGAAFGDLDGDGDVDVVVNNNGGALSVLRNVAPKRGKAVTLRLLGAQEVDDAGAQVDVQVGDQLRRMQSQRASSYCTSNDPRVHVGLGSAPAIDRAVVTWTDGFQEVFGPFEAGTQVDCVRGQGRKP